MSEKKYLKWYNKVGYGSGDVAGNVIYAFLTFFLMIFLTDTMGMNAGIIGTLMMVSKIFDGFSDIIFGSFIDKTKSKMGKARPWMFYGFFGCAVLLVAIFAIPTSWGDTAKYIYFFITYTLLNAGFYTANNIAYGALTALVTRNGAERVQLGTFRFIFATATSMTIQAVTVGAVAFMGNDAAAWRWMAIIYAVIGIITNTIAVFSVKELPDSETGNDDADKNTDVKPEKKYSFKESMKLLLHNKYFVILCGTYILTQLYTAMTGMGIYYTKYILGNAELLGTFSLAINIPMIIGLVSTPFLVSKCKGMYKLNITGYIISSVFRVLVLVGGYLGNVPMMLICLAISTLGMGPLQGDINALIAAASDYTYKKDGIRIDGTMFSCTSLGVKIGGGIGVALTGWLLEASGYIENAVVQSQSCVNMLNFIYLWLPLIINVIITVLLCFLKVEKANKDLDAKAKETMEETVNA